MSHFHGMRAWIIAFNDRKGILNPSLPFGLCPMTFCNARWFQGLYAILDYVPQYMCLFFLAARSWYFKHVQWNYPWGGEDIFAFYCFVDLLKFHLQIWLRPLMVFRKKTSLNSLWLQQSCDVLIGQPVFTCSSWFCAVEIDTNMTCFIGIQDDTLLWHA